MKIKNQKGFTLIELIVAIFILVVGISAVLQMFPLGIQTAKTAQMATVAAQLGQAKIEEIISKSYDEISVGETTESYGEIPDFDAYKRVTAINCVDLDLQEVACDYDPTNNPDPVKKIEVTVFWKSPLGVSEKSAKIASLIAKR